ncbi:uncharacterized protein LOC130898867 isoform X4 [Diorhabda carinulata]|uniref:uncharacterized protein LOC130898867 isoform X4 n=1 Tax=Diorhabda carinulata TaxID=1163345 RepID=UPI0025A159ED|nr:uncharacterized protein LOC130898867 isoform X4 [Diorhabda carinulata]
MRDDPVKLMLKLETLGQNKNNFWIIEYMYLSIFVLIEIAFLLPGLYLLANGTNLDIFIEYFTPYCFLQSGCAGLIISANFMSKSEIVTSTLYNISKVLETQSTAFKMKILKKARMYNTLSVVISILSVCVHLSCLPLLIDDGFENFTFYTVKRFYGDGPSFIYILLIFPCLIAAGLAIVQPVLFFIYFTFHIQLQLMWLNEYVIQNLHKKLNIHTKNGRDQELIHEHLLNVVKYRLCFKSRQYQDVSESHYNFIEYNRSNDFNNVYLPYKKLNKTTRHIIRESLDRLEYKKQENIINNNNQYNGPLGDIILQFNLYKPFIFNTVSQSGLQCGGCSLRA